MRGLKGWLTASVFITGILASNAQKKDGDFFSEIKFSDEITQIVNYTSLPIEYYSGTPRIEIKGTQKQIATIDIDKSAKSITLRNKSSNVSCSGMSVKVYGEDISSFILYGSGNFKAENIDVTGMIIRNYGSGDIKIENFDSVKLEVDLYGSGDTMIENIDCTSLVILSNGSGNIKMKDIDVTAAEIIQHGSGNSILYNIDATTFKATNNGSGDILIEGDVTSAVLISNGSGDIRAKSLKYGRVTPINNGTGTIKL